MDSVIILDTDMASAFAKIKRLELLKRLFSKHRIVITPEIYEDSGHYRNQVCNRNYFAHFLSLLRWFSSYLRLPALYKSVLL